MHGNPENIRCRPKIEYQVAGHLVAEGMITEGLAICRAIHDRYQPQLYNPYNEIECGDHYARAMASWGVFLALSGYEYHGPKGHLAFSPKMTPEHFKSAFTAAEGWGTFEQTRLDEQQTEKITVRWGQLRLKRLAFTLASDPETPQVTVLLAGQSIPIETTTQDDRMLIYFNSPLIVKKGETVQVNI